MLEDEIKEYDNARQEIFFREAKKAQKEIEDYKKRGKGAYYHYKMICEDEAELIKKLAGDFQDDRIYMAIYVYLYRNGYLSFNKNFEFGVDEEEISCNMGLSVITGKGVCRNIASHFKDILTEMKKKESSKKGILLVGTNINEQRDQSIPREELPKEFNINYSKEIKNDEEQSHTKREFLPTHAEVIVMDSSDKDYTLMLYDPTNIRITKIDYSKSAETGERRAVDFRYGIWDIDSNLSTLEEREQFIKRFGGLSERIESSKREEYTKHNLETILNIARNQCNNSIRLIEEFYSKKKLTYRVININKKDYLKEERDIKDDGR